MRARLILGVNLEANQPPIAVAEARALLSGIGFRSVLALEIGNEPNWYATLPWYRSSGGRPVLGRPRTYDLRAFTAEFSALRKRLPTVALAGPTVGSLPWLQNLRRFLAAEQTLRVVTVHRYPLNRCVTTPGSPNYPTVANMLSPSASRGLADGITRYVTIAHHRGDTFRIDEMNSVACGGKARGQRHIRFGALGPRRPVRRGSVWCRRCQHPHVSRRPLRPVHVSPSRCGLVRVRAPGVLRSADVRAGSSARLAATVRDATPGVRKCVRGRHERQTGGSASS